MKKRADRKSVGSESPASVFGPKAARDGIENGQPRLVDCDARSQDPLSAAPLGAGPPPKESFSVSVLAQALHISRSEVQKWIDRSCLQLSRDEGTETIEFYSLVRFSKRVKWFAPQERGRVIEFRKPTAKSA